MKVETNCAAWAEATFGDSDLGHLRRTQRLVKLAGDLAASVGDSTAKASGQDSAALEGAYRFLRNPYVDPEQIAMAGFRASAARAAKCDTVLAIEDTTSLSYTHSAIKEMGVIGGLREITTRGLHAHSVLLVDAGSGATIGLAAQHVWMRFAKAKHYDQRPFQDRESFKWQTASESLRTLLGQAKMKGVVSVCDREADAYPYLVSKIERNERFVVRAARNRRVHDDVCASLRPTMKQAPKVGRVTVEVPQRGERPARRATLVLHARQVQLRRPTKLKTWWPRSLSVGAILAYEERPPADAEPLEWLLLTTEPIDDSDDVLRVLSFYKRRWRIEEFHKAWKSGAGAERCRMQSASNIRRITVILAFVAVRVLQLSELFDQDPDAACDRVLTETEWKVLWVAVEKSRPPKRPPSAKWAYWSLGRLAGWADTKGTGRVGWITLSDGWLKLEERVAGFEANRFLDGASFRNKK